MRRFLSLLLIAVSSSISAQDMIVTKSGDVITAFEVEIGPSSVYYKEGSIDGAMKKISKDDVFVINKKDGTKIKMDESGTTQQVASPAVAPSNKESLMQNNQALIKMINDRMFSIRERKDGKKGKLAYCKLNIAQNSVLETEDLVLMFGTSGNNFWFRNTILKVQVKNKTDQTLYIDLGNTYFNRGDEAQAFYVPSAESTTTTHSTGLAVNLGGIAGAMGVGGALGSLASGVTVGGGKSQSSTSVEFSQRIVSVPPMSVLTLPNMPFFYGGMISIPGIMTKSYPKYGVVNVSCGYKGLMAGDIVHWTEQNSPYRFSLFLSYSKDEGFSAKRNTKVNFYVSEVLGIGRSANTGGALLKNYNNLWGVNAPLFILMRNDPEDMVPFDVDKLNVERLEQ